MFVAYSASILRILLLKFFSLLAFPTSLGIPLGSDQMQGVKVWDLQMRTEDDGLEQQSIGACEGDSPLGHTKEKMKPPYHVNDP